MSRNCLQTFFRGPCTLLPTEKLLTRFLSLSPSLRLKEWKCEYETNAFHRRNADPNYAAWTPITLTPYLTDQNRKFADDVLFPQTQTPLLRYTLIIDDHGKSSLHPFPWQV